jgi:hypothetical protein
LDERYRQGRSRVWYWRQALGAIAASLFAVIRSERILAIRALLIGWSAFFFCFPFLPRIIRLLRGYPTPGTGLLPSSWTRVEWLYVRGWIVPQGDAYVVAVICCVFAFGVGFLVGRLNRPRHRQAIAIFVASWFVCFVPATAIAAAKMLHDWSATYWRYDNPYFFIFAVASSLVAMFSALAGGVVADCQRDSLQS